jgi:hypothetical protein
MNSNPSLEQVLSLSDYEPEMLVENRVIKETDDPKLKYRKEIEDIASANNGEISALDLKILEVLRVRLGLLPEEAFGIKTEVLSPYREHNKRLQEYRRVFVEAIRREPLLKSETRNGLKRLQELLNLNDEDVKPLEAQIIQKRKGTEKNSVWVLAGIVCMMLLVGIGSWATVSFFHSTLQEPTSQKPDASQPLL